MKDLFKKIGVDIEAKRESGLTSAHFAAWYGYTEILKVLEGAGVDIGAKNNDGMTPAHFAAQEGHTEVLKCLRELGADLEVEDNHGRTPLSIAINSGGEDGYPETERYLVEEVKVNVNIINKKGDTLLDLVNRRERRGCNTIKIKDLLIRNGAKTGEELREEEKQEDLSKKVAYGRAASPCKKGIKVNSRKKSIRNK